MNRLTFGVAAAALATILPMAAQAQQLPAPVIAVVDTDRIIRECTVCVAANTQLQSQLQQLQTRATQLGTPLQTEEQALQTAVNALGASGQPDAALTQRIQTFQTNRNNAQTEITTRQAQIERNVQFVRQQIAQRVLPAAQQVGQQRGASLVLDRGQVLHVVNPALDITAAVLAQVNTNTTALNVNAPPPAPAAGQTPAQQPQQPNQPRPQGR